MRILIIEDDATLNEQMATALRKEHYAVDCVYDGEEGHFCGDTEPYDAVILDLGLPKIDGLTVLKKWRNNKRTMPVLILTARDGFKDKVDGLNDGADDFVTKPFNMEEVLARIKALIRRTAGHAAANISCGPVSLDTRTSRVTVNGMAIDLTAHEMKIFSYLMYHCGEVISQTELTEHIYDQHWDENSDKDSNTIAVFISRLRRKLPRNLIQTVRGSGYRLSEDAE